MISKIGFLFMIVGLVFDFFGCLGLLRLPDIYNRLQAATKCITLGTCSILFGMALIVGVTASGIKAILCLIFLLLTSPVAAHALAKAAHIAGVKLWDGSVVDKYKEDGK
ncbi:MAG: monovalent cation/H(+) antiporter subunit G [Candidatus Omnitrophica bacterium]|nr:monovalent cation/H(+) antiporter subunit G [Candidatus Omnitrophota bacterium]MBU4487514.1 monovalent cation/H(+) antiporter subunit G [Candidatus Omnitrophota bacterium]MCG2704898.1 monovalent cation/H(+) antiporter subunit G [Candidatus Omnitrophota bacterium]